MEYVVLAAIVSLWALGSLIPTGHSWTQQHVYATYAGHTRPRRRFGLPYTKEDLKILHRIWATWRVEHVSPDTDALTQHFEVLANRTPYYENRKTT